MKLIAKRDEETIQLEVRRATGGYEVLMGDHWIAVDLVHANRFLRSVRFPDGRQFLITHESHGPAHEVVFDDTTIVRVELHDPLTMRRKRREDEGGAGRVLALMPGRVVRVLVEPGQAVRKGEPLLIIEAMKMENEIRSAGPGTVTEVFVEPGQTVESGAPLVTITA